MAKIYQIVKAFLASADMCHVWLSFVLTVIFADVFMLMDTADKWQIVILSGVLSFFVGVFVESFDGSDLFVWVKDVLSDFTSIFL